jgi:hypothetical protein
MIKTSPPNLLSSLYVEAHSKSRREDDGHLRELCGEAHDTILALREAARKAEETLRLGRAFAGVSAAEFGNWCGHADLVEQELRAALGSIPARWVEPAKSYADGLNDALGLLNCMALAVDEEEEGLEGEGDDARLEQLDAVQNALARLDENIRCLPGYVAPTEPQPGGGGRWRSAKATMPPEGEVVWIAGTGPKGPFYADAKRINGVVYMFDQVADAYVHECLGFGWWMPVEPIPTEQKQRRIEP